MTINQLQAYYEKLAEQKWPDATLRDVQVTIIIRDFGMHQYHVSFRISKILENKTIYDLHLHTDGFVFGGLKKLRSKVNEVLEYYAKDRLDDFTEDQEVEIPGFVPVKIDEYRKTTIAFLKIPKI